MFALRGESGSGFVSPAAQARVLVRRSVRAPALLALRAVVERRIGEDVIGLEVGVLVVGVGVAELDVAVEAVNEEIQPAEAIGEVLRSPARRTRACRCDARKVALHEHAARAAARVEHFALLGSSIATSSPHDALRREVFAAALALRRGELADEVLIDAPEHIDAAVLRREDVLREKVDEPARLFLVEIRPGVDRRQQALELREGLLQQREDVIEPQLDVVGAGNLDDVVPASYPRGRGRLSLVEWSGSSRIRRELLVGRVQVALRVGDLGVDLRPRFS